MDLNVHRQRLAKLKGGYVNVVDFLDGGRIMRIKPIRWQGNRDLARSQAGKTAALGAATHAAEKAFQSTIQNQSAAWGN
jgi:hypothetical protein